MIPRTCRAAADGMSSMRLIVCPQIVPCDLLPDETGTWAAGSRFRSVLIRADLVRSAARSRRSRQACNTPDTESAWRASFSSAFRTSVTALSISVVVRDLLIFRSLVRKRSMTRGRTSRGMAMSSPFASRQAPQTASMIFRRSNGSSVRPPDLTTRQLRSARNRFNRALAACNGVSSTASAKNESILFSR